MTNTDLIERLEHHWGMGRGDLAKASGLPVSRIRAWSASGADIPEKALAKLEQLDRWLGDAAEAGADEPANALTLRLVDGYTATGWDLYCNDEADALLRIVAGADPALVLTETFSDWRTRFDSNWEVFDAEDGMPGVRLKPGYRSARAA